MRGVDLSSQPLSYLYYLALYNEGSLYLLSKFTACRNIKANDHDSTMKVVYVRKYRNFSKLHEWDNFTHRTPKLYTFVGILTDTAMCFIIVIRLFDHTLHTNQRNIKFGLCFPLLGALN